MREKIFLFIYNSVKKKPALFVVLAFLCLFIFLLAYFNIPLKSDYIDLLPQKLEPVKKIKLLSEKLKGVGQFSIVIQSAKRDTAKMIEAADILYNGLKDFTEIDYINYKIPDSFKRAAFLFVDINDLKEIYDDSNVTEFNNFVLNVLHPDFNKTMHDIKKFKESYNNYIKEENRNEFKNALKNLKDEYADCTGVKTKEMSKLMDQYYKHKAKMWDQIIKSMKQRGLTTEEMEEVREKLLDRLNDLEDAINSGDQAKIAEQLRLMNQENVQLWAKFHSGRLNSYLNRIEPAANKYGRSDEVKKIKARLHKFDNLSDEDKNNAKKVWAELKNNADDMREMSKGMLKQKIKNEYEKGRGRN